MLDFHGASQHLRDTTHARARVWSGSVWIAFICECLYKLAKKWCCVLHVSHMLLSYVLVQEILT